MKLEAACTLGSLGRTWSEWTWEWGKHSFSPGLQLPKQCHPWGGAGGGGGKTGVQITQGTLLLAGDCIRGDVSMALASAGSRRVQWEVRSVGAGVVENRQCFFL